MLLAQDFFCGALLTTMAWAAARLGLVAGLGGALFVVSDMLIATGVADWPPAPRPDLWIMLTYLAAQYLLVRGVLGDPLGLVRPRLRRLSRPTRQAHPEKFTSRTRTVQVPENN